MTDSFTLLLKLCEIEKNSWQDIWHVFKIFSACHLSFQWTNLDMFNGAIDSVPRTLWMQGKIILNSMHNVGTLDSGKSRFKNGSSTLHIVLLLHVFFHQTLYSPTAHDDLVHSLTIQIIGISAEETLKANCVPGSSQFIWPLKPRFEIPFHL